MKIIAASGGFDPLHVGHVEYLTNAKALGDRLVVILNSDDWLLRKKGYIFMPFSERKKILESLRVVDEVVASIDTDMSVSQTLRVVRPTIFAKGGDRFATEIPETNVCKELGITVIDGLGAKIQASSALVEKMRKSLSPSHKL